MDYPVGYQQSAEQIALSTLFQHDHGQYARNIREYSERSADTSLYSGQAFQNLVRSHFSRNMDGKSPEDLTGGFASYYSVFPNHPVTYRDVSDYSFLRSISEATKASTQSGHVLILRGYPPADFLRHFGAAFDIDPEFFRRHTDYLTTFDIQDLFVDPTLPSHGDSVLQIKLTTIGSRRSLTHHGYDWEQIQELRADSAANMQDYLSNLRKGKDWKPGNSIVRGFTVHDEDLFSIDQKATIYTKSLSQTNNNNHWLVTIWLDCGQDLGNSPRGPWISKRLYGAQLKPIFRHNLDSRLQATPTLKENTSQFPQAATNLYRPTNSSIENDLSVSYPFSALFEVLLFSAAAESQFLNMISRTLRFTREMLFNASTDENVIVAARNNLTNSLDSLEEHLKDYQKTIAFIRRQNKRNVAQPSDTDQQNVLDQIISEFESLVSRCELLCHECGRTMAMAMSNASIAEAKRGLEQSQSLFKFTVLASVYVPLSFTASFFGMNFREIGQGNLSIWLYFIVSLPVFALSALTLFLDKNAIQRFFSRHSRSDWK